MRPAWLPFVVLTLIPRVGAPQGDPVGPEFRVNTYTTDYQRSGSVAGDSSGNFVVIWESRSQDGSTWGIFGQRYAASGVPLGSEFRVNSYTTSYQWISDVASDSSGNFIVVWADDYFPQPRGVFGQRYSSTGVPLGSEFRINAYTPFQTNSPSVACDSSGNFVVVWASQYQDGSGSGVFGQRYDSTGTPLGSEFRVNTYTTSNQIDPSVAADSPETSSLSGESATQDGSGSGVFGQRYASTGVSLSSEFRVNTYTTGGQGVCAASSDSSGNLVVVWTSYAQDGSNSGVFGQRFVSSGAPLGPEFRINTYTTDSQGAPTVASDAAGNFVVIWSSQQDGSLNGMVGQRFDSSGSPLGPEFRANAYTTGAQSLPSVASDPSGNFIVVWTSDAQDGSSGGIFSQRYNQIVPVELMRFGVE